jgi:HEAT repeat protein
MRPGEDVVMVQQRIVSQRRVVLVLTLSVFFVCHVSAATEGTAMQCNDILRQALAASNPDTRRQAVLALSVVGERFVSVLQYMLQDKDVQVRLATVESLADVKTKRATAALHMALDDEVPEVAFAAAKALWDLGDPVGKQELLAVLQGESKSASGVFSKQKRDTLRLMHVPQAILMFALRQGIGLVPVPYLGLGIASMHAILEDPEVSGRGAAALLLGNATDQATLDALKDALGDKEWSVRAAAVHSLALRKDPRLKNDLAPLLEDDNQAVRLRAAAGYLRLSAMPGLAKTPVSSSIPRRAP